MPSRPPSGSLGAALIALLSAALFAAGCSNSAARVAESNPATPVVTATPRPLPPPVAVSPEPQGITLDDPSFDALDGAKAYFGTLGGAAYRIEIPDRWNGRLVMYMHGFQGLAPKASVESPAIRAYLIRNGYAWAASSYSSTALIPGRAADETAALWDEFVRRFGRPQYTYATGQSMGGGATNIVAERYANRFDGALSLCGLAGQSSISQLIGDYFVAGAYVAGVSQAEFDAATDVAALIRDRIQPALAIESNARRWEAILQDLTGGARPFAREGFQLEQATNWARTSILITTRLSYNADRQYQLTAAAGVSSADFNRDVIRIAPDAQRVQAFLAGNETTGDLKMPLLTLHTTGDWQVPVDEERILRQRVEAAGQGDFLVQRLVRAAPHCGFTDGEWEQGFTSLVNWVEGGQKPEGENVSGDLSNAGAQFTLAPRIGSPEVDRIAGAADRVTVSGNLLLDGKPLPSAFMWLEVEKDGLRQVCSYRTAGPEGGSYAVAVAAASEAAGCGAPGARVYLASYQSGRLVFSSDVAWPSDGARTISLDAAFSSTAPRDPAHDTTPVFGALTRADGAALPVGTRIEAWIGDTLCGVGSLNAAVMQFSNPDAFDIFVASPESRPGCTRGGAISFRVDGTPVAGTLTNALDSRGQQIDLVLP